jgi:hypothetical protein
MTISSMHYYPEDALEVKPLRFNPDSPFHLSGVKARGEPGGVKTPGHSVLKSFSPSSQPLF